MLWVVLLGVVTGMRGMTAIAVLCWFAWDGAFPSIGTGWAFWAAKLVPVAIFTLLAVGEYVGDISPRAPSRKSFLPALARLLIGGLTGAIAATMTLQPAAGGAILGVLGAIVGTWGGWSVRHWLAEKMQRDRIAGLLESAFALVLAIVVCIGVHSEAMDAIHAELKMLR